MSKYMAPARKKTGADGKHQDAFAASRANCGTV